MTDTAWFILFDTTKDSFKWFWLEYGFAWNDLIILRDRKMRWSMETLMNDVWFALPDNKFNIVENPKGWSEFLSLIED